MMTDVEEARPAAGTETCQACHGPLPMEAAQRGLQCINPGCYTVWVEGQAYTAEQARINFVAGNLLAKCIRKDTVLPRGYVSYGKALAGVRPEDQQYFRDAVELMTKLRLVSSGKSGAETYGIVRENLDEATDFALRWATEERAGLVALGTGLTKSLSEEKTEPEVPPPGPTPADRDMQRVLEVQGQHDNAIRRLREDLADVKRSTGVRELSDLDQRIHGIEILLEEQGRIIRSFQERDLVDRKELETHPTVDQLDAFLGDIKKTEGVVEGVRRGVVAALGKFTRQAEAKAAKSCLVGCGKPATKTAAATMREPETGRWDLTSAIKNPKNPEGEGALFTCEEHSKLRYYYIRLADTRHLGGFPRLNPMELGRSVIVVVEHGTSRRDQDLLARAGVYSWLEMKR